jgi:hypothetical protein
VFALPARAISTKNKHLLVIYSTPTRGFTAAVSVFRGTPPPKPLDCKIWLDTFGALVGDRWSHSTGGEPRFSRALFSFVSVDIIEMSPSSLSQFVHLSFYYSLFRSPRLRCLPGNKKPCFLHGKQGSEKSGSSLYLLTSGLFKFEGTVCPA